MPADEFILMMLRQPGNFTVSERVPWPRECSFDAVNVTVKACPMPQPIMYVMIAFNGGKNENTVLNLKGDPE